MLRKAVPREMSKLANVSELLTGLKKAFRKKILSRYGKKRLFKNQPKSHVELVKIM